MSAKGKGKGKMYSNNVPAQVPSSSTKLHEGALDNSYYVQAKMKDGKLEKAKIIECRLSKDYDSKQTKTEDSYDYYVHYENYNRRMDEWVNRDRIQMTMDLIQGDEIYRDTERRLSMFEIDGHKNSTYCENLCYIAHLPLLIKKRLREIPYFNKLHCLSSRERQALRKDPWWTQAIIEFLRKNKDNEITMNQQLGKPESKIRISFGLWNRNSQ